jgi:hypothetical protein
MKELQRKGVPDTEGQPAIPQVLPHIGDTVSGGIMPDDDGCIPNPWDPPPGGLTGDPAGPVNRLPGRSLLE